MNDPSSHNSTLHSKDTENGHEEFLLAQAAAGNRESLGDLMQLYRERLERVVRFRMNPKLKGRIDAGDVVQESFLEAAKRFDYYLENRKTSFFLWLRLITLQKLNEQYRFHTGAKARSTDREVSIFGRADAAETTSLIAAHLFDDSTSPSQAIIRDEARLLIERALSEMDPLDQEVLALRHFEQLSNAEVAASLGIATGTASKRFVRALQRLKTIVDSYPQ